MAGRPLRVRIAFAGSDQNRKIADVAQGLVTAADLLGSGEA